MDRCVACSTDDEMLFACRHCEQPFCRAHLLDHDCDASPEDEREEADEERTGTEGAQAAVAGVEGTGGTRTQSVTEGALETGVVEPEPRSEAIGTADTTDEQAPAEHAPLMRTMDTRRPPGTLPRRDPQTVTEWIRQQTYFTLLVKVGSLALLLNLVVFGGLTVVRYGLLGGL